jgi:predicted dehydrogenase
MLRAGIIGCGKIAEQHADEIQRIPNCEIVGVCDTEELMARQMYERFRVKEYFSDVHKFLAVARPDVVQITTPAKSHFDLGQLCLQSGANVYIEKPFTINTEEAERLINLAKEKNLKITAGHNAQFSHVARKMRRLVKSGFLGGNPVHMESYYCYDLSDPSYARALLGDKNHWVRALPGKLLQNIISHGISKIAEFMSGDSPTVIAHGFPSQVLQSIGENEIIDELRVIIHDEENRTAYFTFSSQMRPALHQLRIYGPKNGLIVDDDQQTITRLKGTRYKSYLEQILPSLILSRQYASNAKENIKDFLKRDLHVNSGMRFLIRAFYQSVVKDVPVPIPYREIILTSKIMDAIFGQINHD